MKNRLVKIENPLDIKVGDLLLIVDIVNEQSVQYVDCIDGDQIYTHDHRGPDLNRLFSDDLMDYLTYNLVYRIL